MAMPCAEGETEGMAQLRLLVGMSESEATIWLVNGLPSSMTSVPGFARVGALFTSVTKIVTVCVVVGLGEPSSLTRTRKLFVLGPCASLGVQLKTPVSGSIVAPLGAPDKLKVKCCAGRSES